MNLIDFIKKKLFRLDDQDRLSGRNIILFIIIPFILALFLVFWDIPKLSDAVAIFYGIIYVPITLRIFREQISGISLLASGYGIFLALFTLLSAPVEYVLQIENIYVGGMDGMITPTLCLILTPIFLFTLLKK